MQLQIPQGPAPQTDYFEFTGGLDQVTPAMKMPPGRLLEALNWDIPAEGGYRRIPGYERYDGRSRPSDASALILGAATTYSGLVAGDSITGGTSGATATVAYVAADSTYIAVTKITGTFTVGENILEGVTVRGVYALPNYDNISSTTNNAIAEAAADIYRADIAAPTGSGSILGGVSFGGVQYVWRPNAGGTAADVWKSTASGWSQITLAEEVSFSNANTSVGVGDTLTQGGVTATIRRVIVQSGTLASGTNTGKLVITGRAGGALAAGAASSTGGGSLTLSGAQTAQSFPATGKYRFRIFNFGGASPTRYVYGVNGVGRGFEFDGTYFAFIDTGASNDAPDHVAVFANQLFFALDDSLQHSAPGEPHVWDPIYGAAELATGAEITNLLESTAALQVYTKNYIKALVGTGVGNWSYQAITLETGVSVGARTDTVQSIGQPVFLDSLGITNITASQAYGKFQWSELSRLIKPYLNPRISLAVCSVVLREHGQYKLFFSDGTGITMTFAGNNVVGTIPFTLGFTPNVAWEDESNGNVFVGATNGMVYELERGRSQDGDNISHRLRFAWNFSGTPSIRKHYRRATFDCYASGYATVGIGHQVGRNDSEVDSASVGATADFGDGGVAAWDDPNTSWDESSWDGDGYTQFGCKLDTTGTDISLSLSGESDNQLAFTLSGATLTFTRGRIDRRHK